MIRRPPRSTRTDTLFPYTTLFRSKRWHPFALQAKEAVMSEPGDSPASSAPTDPWNKGKLIGPKPPLQPKHVWSIRTRLQLRSEEHTSELQSLMRISYAVFCLKKKKKTQTH